MLPRWLDALTLDAVYARHGALVLPALHAGLSYGVAPRLGDGETVEAVLVHPDDGAPRAGQHFGVSLGPSGVTPGAWTASCVCRGWQGCLHVTALLIDLSLSPALREAVGAGRPMATRDALAALGAQRAALLRALAAEEVASGWITVRAADEPVVPVWCFDLPTEDAGPVALQGRAMGFDGMPALTVKLRLPGKRATLDGASVASASMPPGERALVRLLHSAGAGRKHLRATGTDVSVALELARKLPTERVQLEDGGAMQFSARALTLSLVAATLPRSAVTRGTPEAQGFSSREGVRDGRWTEAVPDGDATVPALEARWRTVEGEVDVPARASVLVRGPFPAVWVPAQRTLFRVAEGVDLDVAWQLQMRPAAELVEGHAGTIYRALRQRLRGRGVSLPSAASVGVALEVARRVVRVDGLPLAVVAYLDAVYAHATVHLGAPEVTTDPRRDPDLEAAARARMADAGLRWDATAGQWVARDLDAVDFWRRGVDTLRGGDDPLEVTIAGSMRYVRIAGTLRPVVRASVLRGELDLALELQVDGRAAEIAHVRAALAQKKRWVALDDGALAEIGDLAAELLARDLEGFEAESDTRLRGVVPMHQIGRVLRWAEDGHAELDEALRTLRGRWRAATVAAVPEMPRGLAARLRPYQAQGLAWLQWLDALGAGGVLADDMGLGKTVMALGLLQWRMERDGRAPSLVVAPTSVVSNWAREAARFAPGLRVVALHGASAEARRAEVLESADVVLTSYALLRRDAGWLAARRFRYLLLDEAQTLKNADAATTRAARGVQAQARIALSGTPMENRLLDLWSLLDLCNPGMLGGRKAFVERFERPVALAAAPGADPARRVEARQALDVLRARVRPVVLRRTKAEVLDDLPPREEIDLVCALDAEQRRRYEALLLAAREDVGRAARKAGRAQMAVFTALLRLRQAACDVRLLDPTAEGLGGKRGVFLARMRELAAEGRKVLVFSQFVELLRLWGRDLDAEGIGYETLDGSTVDRDGAIARFAHGDATAFLVSLKAGGTGLNLTMADTVLHCDPWWNPAVQDQATDRAHRIGQTRPVTVYRLIARGTVEERVVALCASKRDLAARVTPDGEVPAGLTEADLEAILADAAPDALDAEGGD